MVVFDATFLMCVFRPDASLSTDRVTGALVHRMRDRLDFLVSTIEKTKLTVGIPAPALSEILVRAGVGESQKIVEAIGLSHVFRIMPFDALAAIEVATMSRDAIARGQKSDGSTDVWAKVKYDRQIIAIAKVHRATGIYSDDVNLRKHAERSGIPVTALVDLPLPPEDPQTDMFKDIPPDEAEIAAAEIALQERGEPPSPDF